jgi:hypothetical protein
MSGKKPDENVYENQCCKIDKKLSLSKPNQETPSFPKDLREACMICDSLSEKDRTYELFLACSFAK